MKRDKKNKIIWTSSSSTSSQAGGAAMKYRPPRETPREETKGKLPCAEAASVQQVGDTVASKHGLEITTGLYSQYSTIRTSMNVSRLYNSFVTDDYSDEPIYLLSNNYYTIDPSYYNHGGVCDLLVKVLSLSLYIYIY